MDQTACVCEGTVAAHERLACDRCLECFDTKNVLDDFLCRIVNFRVHKCHLIIACDHIAQGRKPLLDSLDPDIVRQLIADDRKFTIGDHFRH